MRLSTATVFVAAPNRTDDNGAEAIADINRAEAVAVAKADWTQRRRTLHGDRAHHVFFTANDAPNDDGPQANRAHRHRTQAHRSPRNGADPDGANSAIGAHPNGTYRDGSCVTHALHLLCLNFVPRYVSEDKPALVPRSYLPGPGPKNVPRPTYYQ